MPTARPWKWDPREHEWYLIDAVGGVIASVGSGDIIGRPDISIWAIYLPQFGHLRLEDVSVVDDNAGKKEVEQQLSGIGWTILSD